MHASSSNPSRKYYPEDMGIMNMVFRQLPVMLLLATSSVLAETTVMPAAPSAPAVPAKVVAPTATPRPATAVAPAVAPQKQANVSATPVTATPSAPPAPSAAAASPVFENILNTTPVITPEQRRQQEMLANAERVDKANRELLARNQELQLQMENLSIQNNVLKRDKSNEGIWRGAGAVIVGFLMGWFFAGVGRRKSSW